jgi:hypothetical protein
VEPILAKSINNYFDYTINNIQFYPLLSYLYDVENDDGHSFRQEEQEMFRMLSGTAVAAVFLMIPAQLMAGGPPRLCLPIDGVTADNATMCAKRLADTLGDKLWPHSRPRGVEMRQNEKQWYAMFTPMQAVKLSEIDAALKGSAFSVPRDKLRLFGHVILAVDNRSAPPKELMTELEAMEYVSVAESKRAKGLLLVTVDMPYPRHFGKQTTHFGSVPLSKEIFRRTDFSSDASTKNESPATSRDLPSFNALCAVVEKHNATLRDLSWSNRWACRMLGCVAVLKTDGDTSKANTAD